MIDDLHTRLHLRGRQDPDRGGCDRYRRDFLVSRQSALDIHPDRHHPAVADRRDDRARWRWLLDQPPDAIGAGARHRPRRRRCDRRGREHSPPHRGGHDAVRRGDPRRARDRAADHRDDHHARGGLRADRLRLGRDRGAVSRIRLHAGGRGHRFRLHRADALADDVLEAVAPRKERGVASPALSTAPSWVFAAPTSAACTAA